MVDRIGETAGEVYRYLETNGEQTLTNLKKGVKASDSLLNMAIGWLAREHKLEFSGAGKLLKLRLKE